MKKYDQRGFTLIELMIVIAIIGILSAMATPNFFSFRNRSSDASIEILLSEICALEKEYRAAQGAYLSAPINPPAENGQWEDSGPWKQLKFNPMQNLYGYSFKVEASEDAFTAVAVKNGQDMFYATHDFYGIQTHPPTQRRQRTD